MLLSSLPLISLSAHSDCHIWRAGIKGSCGMHRGKNEHKKWMAFAQNCLPYFVFHTQIIFSSHCFITHMLSHIGKRQCDAVCDTENTSSAHDLTMKDDWGHWCISIWTDSISIVSQFSGKKKQPCVGQSVFIATLHHNYCFCCLSFKDIHSTTITIISEITWALVCGEHDMTAHPCNVLHGRMCRCAHFKCRCLNLSVILGVQ